MPHQSGPVTDWHGQFLTTTLIAHICIGAFTQNVWLCMAAELLVSTMIFFGPLVPTPVTADLVLELNLYFPLAAIGGAVVGVLLAKAVCAPVLLETELRLRHYASAYGIVAWLRSLFSLLLITILPLLLYDYSISEWYPHLSVMTTVLRMLVVQVVVYACVYRLMCRSVGARLPFQSKYQVQRVVTALFVVTTICLVVMGWFTDNRRDAAYLMRPVAGLVGGWILIACIIIQKGTFTTGEEVYHAVLYYHAPRLMHRKTAMHFEHCMSTNDGRVKAENAYGTIVCPV